MTNIYEITRLRETLCFILAYFNIKYKIIKCLVNCSFFDTRFNTFIHRILK